MMSYSKAQLSGNYVMTVVQSSHKHMHCGQVIQGFPTDSNNGVKDSDYHVMLDSVLRFGLLIFQGTNKE